MPVTTIRGGRQITDGTIPYVDIQNVTANTILGNNTASPTSIQEISLSSSNLLGRGTTGNISAITASTGLEFSGTALQTTANLRSLHGLTFASTAFVKMTGANTFTLDTSTYIAGSTGSTDNAILRADGTGGNTVQASSISIDDSANITLGTTGLAGTTRTITVDGSSTNIGLTLESKGASGLLKLKSLFNVQVDGGVFSILTATTSTNTTKYVAEFNNILTGTATTGLGVGVILNLPTSAGTYQTAASYQAVWTNATNGSESSDLIFNTRLSAVTGEKFRIISTGQLKLANYTSASSFTGTPVGYLQFDSSGNILTSSLPPGGNVTKVGTPVDNQVAVWTGDGTIEGTAQFTFDSGTRIATMGTLEIGKFLSAGSDATLYKYAGLGVADYALSQNFDGKTFLNAKTGEYIRFTIGNSGSPIMHFTQNGLHIGDIANISPARRFHITRESSDNLVNYAMRLTQQTTITPASGLGIGIEFEVETAATPNLEIGATIEALVTDVTSTSEDFDLIFKTMAAGATAAERLRILSTGQIKLSNYTTTTSFTGTAAGYLAFDSSGNILTVAVPSSGGITSLNTLTAATQTFATGTSGTDFNISSATSTHTFNIPDASATARGVITTGTQTVAGQKTFSSAINLTSGQIIFPATQSASADANTLDDYEEGSFTPSLSAIASTFSYNSRVGSYVKIGRVVHITFRIQLNTTGNTLAANALTITGLPFQSGSTTNQIFAGDLQWASFSIAANRYAFRLLETSTTLTLSKLTATTSSSTATNMVATDLNATGGSVLFGTLTYII